MTQYAKEDINAPDSWCCIDCGINTAPGMPTREQIRQAFARDFSGTASVEMKIGKTSEVYQVKGAVWRDAGMEPFGGCLCLGCIEKRIGALLKQEGNFPPWSCGAECHPEFCRYIARPHLDVQTQPI
jgi:hypothetical protein